MLKNILFTIALLFVSQLVNAHGGGHGPVEEKQAMIIAVNTAKQFVEFDPGLDFGKLDASWNNVTIKNAVLHKKGDGYYIIAITNISEKRLLYVLVSIEGEVYDANFSGNFPGLK